MTRYPSIAEYNKAAQHPAKAFTDPELSGGTLATSGLGLPIVLGGGFALTYTVTAQAHKYAVRCFHRYVPDLKQRYAQISDSISGLVGDHFVEFEYQREGVRVPSGPYPVVKMAWAEGPTLGSFIEDNYRDGAAMRALQAAFRDLARFLSNHGIAHGDLENGNMVVRDGICLTLIDYDGMYVPGMKLGDGNELGHAHFQHPGRTPDDFGPRMDDFSFVMVDISLDAIARDPSLYEKFCNGDNILFQRSDYEAPQNSPVFAELRRMPPLADKIDDFAAICVRPIGQVPSLADFLARHRKGGPASAHSSVHPAPSRQRPAGVSNVDFLRSALQKSGTGKAGGPGPAAAPHAAAARSVIPKAGKKSTGTSAMPFTGGSGWPWWLEISIYALILLAVFSSF